MGAAVAATPGLRSLLVLAGSSAMLSGERMDAALVATQGEAVIVPSEVVYSSATSTIGPL